MENKFLISITGIQEVDGETEKIEVMTTGEYIIKNGSRYIKYVEYDNDNPNIHFNNIVKVSKDNNKVTIIRTGDTESRLTLEKRRRHLCHYRTIAGELMIGVYTDTIDVSLDENGGELSVKYQLDFNAGLVSNNEFYITLKK